MKNQTKIALYVTAVILVGLVAYVIGTVRHVAGLETDIQTSWALVDVQLTNRAEYVGQMAQVVKGYDKHEYDSIKAVTDARSKYASASTPEDKSAIANETQRAFINMLAFSENYPDLKANEQFNKLSDSVKDCQSKLVIAKNRYVVDVSKYNKVLNIPPSSWVASWFGYEPKKQYEIDDPVMKTMPTIDLTTK